MILSKETTSVNEFVFVGGVKPKMNPIDYRRALVRTALLTPNHLFTIGLKNSCAIRETVDFVKISTSADSAIVYWQKKPRHEFPELIMLDTQQQGIGCVEVIQRFKALNAVTKILVMGDYFRNEKIEEYFYRGADGYIDQQATASVFRYAIDILLREKKHFIYSPTLPFNGYLVVNPSSDNLVQDE